MANLYRKSSIERLSSPEQLDKALTFTSPLSWLILVAVALMFVVVIVWSIYGSLPTMMDVSGIIISPESVCAEYSTDNGTIQEISVKAGSKISSGDKIGVIVRADGTKQTVTSTQDGTISAVLLANGDPVSKGTELLRITPDVSGKHIVLMYVPLSDAQKLENGMSIIVNPSFADSQKTGHLEANIISIGNYAASVSNLSYVFGNDNMISTQFVQDSPVVAVVCQLKVDSSTKSGYYWSNSKGAKIEISNYMMVSSKIIVDECAPITKLFSELKEITEG